MRDDPDLRATPVIILTGSRTQEDVIRSYELCANAHLTKPVDPAEFIEVVQTFEQFWPSIVRLPNCDG